MWFRKRENDIELSGITEPKQKKKKHEEIDDTNYQPVDWKKFFLSPKYLRMAAHQPAAELELALTSSPLALPPSSDKVTDSRSSMAYIIHTHRHCDSSDNNTAR